MKFPWDKKYLTISFHIIFTLAAIYACKLIFDALAYSLVNLDMLAKAVFGFIGGVLSAFQAAVIAFVIAYLFDPAVDFLQGVSEKAAKKFRRFKKRDKKTVRKTGKNSILSAAFGRREKKEPEYKKRTQGAAILYLGFLALLALPVVSIIRKINDGGPEAMLGELGDAVARISGDFGDLLISVSVTLAERGSMAFFMNFISFIYEKLSAFVKNAGDMAAASVPSLGGFIINFLLGLVIAFYFLRDKEGIKAETASFAEALLPRRAYSWIKKVLRDIHEIFSGYVRGQFADAMIVAGMIWVYLSLIGVDFALMIAVLSGISNMIPYLGAFVCYALAITVAFFSGAPVKALYAAVGIFVIQQIDGILIVPRVVGKSVELSPVSVIISLAVAGELFGIYGMIFAVPVCAAAKLFLTRRLQGRRHYDE